MLHSNKLEGFVPGGLLYVLGGLSTRIRGKEMPGTRMTDSYNKINIMDSYNKFNVIILIILLCVRSP